MNIDANVSAKLLEISKPVVRGKSVQLNTDPDAFTRNIEQDGSLSEQMPICEEKKTVPKTQKTNQEVLVGDAELSEEDTDPRAELVVKAETSEKTSSFQGEALVAFVEVPLATTPVLKVLSTELSPDDLKMYTQSLEMPEVNTASSPIPVSFLSETDIQVLTQEQVLEPFKLVAEFPMKDKQVIPSSLGVNKLETVIYNPGLQAASKPEETPLFVEMVQQIHQTIEKDTPVPELKDSKADLSSLKEPVMAEIEDATAETIKIGANSDKSLAPVLSFEERKATIKTATSVEEPTTDKPIKFEMQDQVAQVVQIKDVQSSKIVTQSMTHAQVMAKAPQVVQDVAVHMKQAIDLGMDKITIQVNPPSLGKIQVELRFSQDGRVNAILMADKVEAYDLLRQSPQFLRDALSGAGVNSDTTDISFSLREDNNSSEQNANQRQSRGNSPATKVKDGEEATGYRIAPSINTTKKVDIHA